MVEHLFFASSFNKWAGPNNPLLDLCNYLHRDLNVNLKLVTHNAECDPSFLKWVDFPFLPILKGSSSNLKTRLPYSPLNVRIIRKLVRSLEVQAERIFVNASIDTLFEVACAVNKRVSVGYNVLGNDTSSTLFNMLDCVAVRTSIGRIVAHTQYQKNLYMRMGLKEDMISVIPHCADLKRIEESAKGGDSSVVTRCKRPIIFYGGRFCVDKGIKELLECFQLVSERHPSTLVLIGDGPLKEWISHKKSQAESKSQGGEIVLIDRWQPPEVLLKWMSVSDIVVLPSYHEMCPMILIEAMCLRKAIVSTRLGGPADIITDGVDGLHIDPNNKDELQVALTKLINGPTLRAHLGMNAFKAFKEKYDVSVVAPKFLKFLEAD